MTKISITSALICDDARREDGGKLILIGVYTGGIVAAQPLPLVINPVIYIAGFAQPGDHAFDFRLMPPTGKKPIVEGAGKLVIGAEHLDNRGRAGYGLPLQLPFLRIEREGIHKVQIRTNGTRWRTVVETDVTVAHDDAAP